MNRHEKGCECSTPEDCQCDAQSTGLGDCETKVEFVDQVAVNSGKTLVNKCFSDPSSIRVRTSRYQTGSTTRKCVLTLDGYSYVIGNALISPKQRHGPNLICSLLRSSSDYYYP